MHRAQKASAITIAVPVVVPALVSIKCHVVLFDTSIDKNNNAISSFIGEIKSLKITFGEKRELNVTDIIGDDHRRSQLSCLGETFHHSLSLSSES